MALASEWKIDEEIKDKYIEKCKLFVNDDEAFKNFRRDEDYGKILEGNAEDIAYIAIEYLLQYGGKEFGKKYIEKFRANDLFGNPRISRWEDLSPGTWRYINSAWQIKMLLGDFVPRRILEIGGGYGGLCRILSCVYDFNDYTNIDLPEAEALWRKYLGKYDDLAGRFNNEISGEYDLFIADSSLAECDGDTQIRYMRQAVKSPFIYITYNTLHKEENRKVYRDIQGMLTNYKKKRIEYICVNGKIDQYTNTLCLKKYIDDSKLAQLV